MNKTEEEMLHSFVSRGDFAGLLEYVNQLLVKASKHKPTQKKTIK